MNVDMIQMEMNFYELRKHSVMWLLVGGATFGEGQYEVVVFSAKRRDSRNRVDLLEYATPCHDAKVVGPYRVCLFVCNLF